MRKSILLIALFLSSLPFVQAQKLDLIPKPVSVQQSAGQLVLPSPLKIVVDKKLKNSADYIAANISRNTGINPIISIGKKHGKNTISFLVDKKLNLPNEAYQLEINEKGIFVKGKTTNGVLNGFHTLVQICSAKEVKKGATATPSPTSETNGENTKPATPFNKSKHKRRRPNQPNRGNQKPGSENRNDSSPS